MTKHSYAKSPDFDHVVQAYKDLYGIDLSNMKMKWSKHPVYKDGRRSYELDDDETGGSWCTDGAVRINPDMRSVMNRFNIDGRVNDFRRKLIAHELAHEVWHNQAHKKRIKELIRDSLRQAREENFTTPYLDTYSPDTPRKKFDSELFAEWVSHQLNKPAPKVISFPEDEIGSLKGRDSIITHRVSKERGKYSKGDVVSAPWGDKYVVSGRSDLNSVEDSPYKEYLTPEQKKELLRKKIALLTLTKMNKKADAYDKKKWPDYDKYLEKHPDEKIKLVERLVREHYAKQRPWGMKMENGSFIPKDKVTREAILDAVVRDGDDILRQRRGMCHELAAARMKMLKDHGIEGHRAFAFWGEPATKQAPDGDWLLGHSMVFFRGDDGKIHFASPKMRDRPRKNFGRFDDLKDAIRQYIAAMKDSGGLTDDDFVRIYDTTDVKFPDRTKYLDYVRRAKKGPVLYEQAPEREFV